MASWEPGPTTIRVLSTNASWTWPVLPVLTRSPINTGSWTVRARVPELPPAAADGVTATALPTDSAAKLGSPAPATRRAAVAAITTLLGARPDYRLGGVRDRPEV